MLERLAELDISIFRAVHQTLYPSAALPVLRVLQLAGEVWGLIPILILVSALERPRVRRFARLGACVLVAIGFCFAAKRLVSEPRPWNLVPHLMVPESWESAPKNGHSWPSGHTTAIFALAAALARLPRRRALDWGALGLVWVVAALTGIARVAVGAHFPSDVVAGALTGLLGAAVGTVLVDLVEGARKARDAAPAPQASPSPAAPPGPPALPEPPAPPPPPLETALPEAAR